MKRLNLVAALVVAALSIMSLPAFAGSNVDAGVFQGTATVGKVMTSADYEECDENPTGPGLGLPIINDTKHAYFRLDTSTLLAAWHGTGRLNICGKVEDVLDNIPDDGQDDNGIGAACGMSKGDDGHGTIEFDGNPPLKGPETLYVDHVGWKWSVGGTFLVLGKLTDTAGNHTGGLTAVVQATGGSTTCVTKQDDTQTPNDPKHPGNKQGGATAFSVVGAFASQEGKAPSECFYWNNLCADDITTEDDKENDHPVFCKGRNSETMEECPYDEKKNPKGQH